MLKKFLSFEDDFSVTKAATIVGFFTLLSKAVAAVRDPLFTGKFGGDRIYILDIYNAAFRIPDFLFTMFIAGTLSVAFIPIFVELLVLDKAKAQKVANTVVTISMLGMGVLFAAVFALADPLARWLVPGFNPEYITETAKLMRLIALSQIVFTLSNTCTNILYAYKRFIFAGIAPLLYNAGIILGITVFYDRFGIAGLGYGVLLGALLHLAIQLPEIFRTPYRLRAAFAVSEKSIRFFWRLYLPRIFVIDLSVFSLLVSTFVASSLKTGSVAIFTLAMNLQSIPISIISLSLATAVFPALSEAYAKKDEAKFAELLRKTIAHILYFMIPMSILMLVFRAQIVRLYYGHGRFTWDNTILTFTAFGVLCFSLLTQSLNPLLARAFYSRQNTIVPVSANLIAMCLNVILALLLSKPFGIVGIAAAFSASSIFNCVLLFILLRVRLSRRQSNVPISEEFDRPLGRVLAVVSFCSILMGFAGYGALYGIERTHLINTHTAIGLLIQSAGAITVSTIVYLFTTNVWNLTETKATLKALRRLLFLEGEIEKNK